MKPNIAVICGGDSSEYEVSLKSGQNIFNAIDTDRYEKFILLLKGREWNVLQDDRKFPVDKNDFSCTIDGRKISFDFAYITIHGVPGENGLLQGYLDMMGIPYSTCNARVEAITFDKYTCTRYLKGMGIATTDPLLVRKGDSIDAHALAENIEYPCFVKPSGEGSSFGVTKVKNAEELVPAIQLASSLCSDIVIEKMVEGTEFTCGLYRTKGRKIIFPVAEIISKNDFFDYEAKYVSGMSDEIIPGRFDEETTDRIQSMASEVYDILGCSGIIRIDGFVSRDRIIMLEVNTTPGMTSNSFVPKMVRAMGIELKSVITDIIEEKLA